MLEAPVRPLGRLRVLLPSLSLVAFAIFAADAAILSVLLPNQIEALDPANKVANLAVVTTVSFTFTIFSQPLIGALSDSTRSRLGRRAPWMILGSIVAGAFLMGIGGFGSVLWISVFWTVIQFALNGVDVASSAFLPDRFPRARRGVASAVIGVGAIFGGAVGTVVAGRLADQLPVAYAVFGFGIIAATTLFVILNREQPTRFTVRARRTRPAMQWRAFLASFWINPRLHPDFAWAFASRFVFTLGYYLVYAFQLYILTDYIHLSRQHANELIGLLIVVTFATILVSVALAGWWSDRVGRRKPFLVAAALVVMVALAVPLFFPTVTGMIVFAALKGVGFGLYLACGLALASETLPNDGESAGKDLGIYNVGTNIPQALAPTLAALVIGAFGGYQALFIAAIVGVAGSIIAISRVRGVR